jgi:hypothetical protein
MFQLSLVFYLIQASLQLLVKVPGSWRSEGLWLCSGNHLVSPYKNLDKQEANIIQFIKIINSFTLLFIGLGEDIIMHYSNNTKVNKKESLQG